MQLERHHPRVNDESILSWIGRWTGPTTRPYVEEEVSAPEELGGSLVRTRHVLRDGDHKEEDSRIDYALADCVPAPKEEFRALVIPETFVMMVGAC
jgi:hypothetical protein